MPQPEEVSLSITGSRVVRPARTPKLSSAACGAAPASAQSATSCCVVRSPSLCSLSSSGWSCGTMSAQSGSRSPVSCIGSQSRPSTVSFSATTSRFTRNTRWSAEVTPARSSTWGASSSQSSR
ncbi:MAG TPA: hypothetical protein VGC67_00085 [Cellulomonas sp.]